MSCFGRPRGGTRAGLHIAKQIPSAKCVDLAFAGNTGALYKTGYSFDGWNTAANGSGTTCYGGDTFVMGSTRILCCMRSG